MEVMSKVDSVVRYIEDRLKGDFNLVVMGNRLVMFHENEPIVITVEKAVSLEITTASGSITIGEPKPPRKAKEPVADKPAKKAPAGKKEPTVKKEKKAPKAKPGALSTFSMALESKYSLDQIMGACETTGISTAGKTKKMIIDKLITLADAEPEFGAGFIKLLDGIFVKTKTSPSSDTRTPPANP